MPMPLRVRIAASVLFEQSPRVTSQSLQSAIERARVSESAWAVRGIGPEPARHPQSSALTALAERSLSINRSISVTRSVGSASYP